MAVLETLKSLKPSDKARMKRKARRMLGKSGAYSPDVVTMAYNKVKNS